MAMSSAERQRRYIARIKGLPPDGETLRKPSPLAPSAPAHRINPERPPDRQPEPPHLNFLGCPQPAAAAGERHHAGSSAARLSRGKFGQQKARANP